MKMRTLLDFLMYDWLNIESLLSRERYADHSRQTFDAVLDTSERLATERFAPFNRLVDIEEPQFDGKIVKLPAPTAQATGAYAQSGLLAAGRDYEVGGMQLPYTVDMAANAFFAKASVGLSAYAMLTSANANLLMTHGTATQREAFAMPQLQGRFMGTMCLSEPQAGSSLGDITTKATGDGDGFAGDELGPRYRLAGNKMWISGGEHELSENIVHLVLAKIADADGKTVPGVRGISLFVVPRKMVDVAGRLTGERNDVALAGLNHKLGYRGTVNTLLNFGEGKFPVRSPGGLDGRGAGAIGYLVGEPGQGLQLMFHMMNEARIKVGMGAAMLGLAGYEVSVDYARNRPQGRLAGASGKDVGAPQVPIVEHADVRRMLLAQKAYCEGAVAFGMYCARLVDEKRTGAPESAQEAALLLDLLTPVVKSWPSEWCLEANHLAIQVHGGYGYTRDFPVEQFWRDNRLNMIHEGTHGIHGLDLLGRKVRADQGRALKLWAARVQATIEHATIMQAGADVQLREHAVALEAGLAALLQATEKALSGGNGEPALENASLYLQAFGHIVLAWTWLEVALAAARQLADEGRHNESFYRGLLQAARYFFRYELPKTSAWLAVVAARDMTCAEMQDAWL
ncbi:MAG: acyl-CoA dehydrogenase [Burkholderiales bacterium]